MLRFVKGKNHLVVPKVINIELTTRCPIKCPQCYKEEREDQALDYVKIRKTIEEVSHLGTDKILLSGGEPLLYKKLLEVINLVHNHKMQVMLSTSGINLTEVFLMKMKKAGLSVLFVSLNGSTEDINSLSRQGYKDAVVAIQLAVEKDIECRINWVARSDNVDDLTRLIEYAKMCGVSGIDILLNKPSYGGRVDSPLSKRGFEKLVRIIKKDNENFLAYQNCFILLKNRLEQKRNARLLKGCSAGIYSMSIKATGGFSPCPHISTESFCSGIMEYWHKDQGLEELRADKNCKNLKCSSCCFNETCRPCRVVSECIYDCVCYEKR
ncbi:MAG: radical SAM/SPASM domain-containing protein [Alkaliphilus sp.]